LPQEYCKTASSPAAVVYAVPTDVLSNRHIDDSDDDDDDDAGGGGGVVVFTCAHVYLIKQSAYYYN